MPKIRAIKGIDEDIKLNKAYGTWPKSSARKESDWLQAPGSGTGSSALPRHHDRQSTRARNIWPATLLPREALAEMGNTSRVKIRNAGLSNLPRRHFFVYSQIVSHPKRTLQETSNN